MRPKKRYRSKVNPTNPLSSSTYPKKFCQFSLTTQPKAMHDKLFAKGSYLWKSSQNPYVKWSLYCIYFWVKPNQSWLVWKIMQKPQSYRTMQKKKRWSIDSPCPLHKTHQLGLRDLKGFLNYSMLLVFTLLCAT